MAQRRQCAQMEGRDGTVSVSASVSDRYRRVFRSIGIGHFFFAVSAVTDTLCSKDAFSRDGPIYQFFQYSIR